MNFEVDKGASVWRHTRNRPFVDPIDKMAQYTKMKTIFFEQVLVKSINVYK